MVDVKLNTLLKVYEMGSYTRAAEKLSLTQPAVSKHIRQLERELGVSIFDRTGPKLRLTPEGKLIVRYAERVIALSDGLRRALADRNRAVDRLRVGVTHTSESSIVAEVLARYTEENVNTRITLRTDALASLYEMLKSYQIDIAIVEGDVSDPAIRTIRLDTDDLAVAVSNEHPLASRPSVTIDELRCERLILRLPSSGTRTLFDANLESRGLSPDDFNVILEVDNIATIKDLVRRNYGVSVLARSACMDELRKGKIRMLPIEDLTMVRQINLLYHHTFEHAEVLQDIVRIYNAATREGSVG